MCQWGNITKRARAQRGDRMNTVFLPTSSIVTPLHTGFTKLHMLCVYWEAGLHAATRGRCHVSCSITLLPSALNRVPHWPWSLLFQLGWLLIELQESVCLCFPMLGWLACRAMPGFYMVAGDLNSGPLVCTARVLTHRTITGAPIFIFLSYVFQPSLRSWETSLSLFVCGSHF